MYTKIRISLLIVGVCFAVVLTSCSSAPTPGAAPASPDQPPSLGAVSPDSGSGKAQTFNATYSHPAGAGKVISAFFLVEKTATGVNSCFVEYNSATNSVNLMNDAGKWQ